MGRGESEGNKLLGWPNWSLSCADSLSRYCVTRLLSPSNCSQRCPSTDLPQTGQRDGSPSDRANLRASCMRRCWSLVWLVGRKESEELMHHGLGKQVYIWAMEFQSAIKGGGCLHHKGNLGRFPTAVPLAHEIIPLKRHTAHTIP